MTTDYPLFHRQLVEQMRALRRALPGPMAGFAQLHRQTVGEPGALDVKQKELIALGIAIAVRCDGCIALHVRAALDAGATTPEILESIGVAILMGGGPAMIYGAEAARALEQFLDQPLPHPD